jgi:hypothetical protein
LGPSNWVLEAGRRRLGLNSGEAALGLGRGTAGRRLGAHLRPKRGRRREWSGAGELGRQCGAVPATAARLPARRRRGWHKARCGEVSQVTRKGVCVRAQFRRRRGEEFTEVAWQPRRRTARAARQGRAGRWRCLNRPGSHGHDVGGEMLPCYGAPRRTRVQTGGLQRARCAYGAATGRRVARGLRCTVGRGSAWKRSASRVVCGLGRR